jgi:hypothetical protein
MRGGAQAPDQPGREHVAPGQGRQDGPPAQRPDNEALPEVEALTQALRKANPGFDGAVKPELEQGAIVGLEIISDRITNLTPLGSAKRLRRLVCAGDAEGSKLSDLSPLKGLPLTLLSCSRTQVADLAPLRGMSLQALYCVYCPVTSLEPLRGMQLQDVNCASTRVADLGPLQGAPLRVLNCGDTDVRDLTPLRGMPLVYLVIAGTRVVDLAPLRDVKGLELLDCAKMQVTDLAPLVGMPLKKLYCDFRPERDTAILRAIPTLTEINGQPAAEFWKEQERLGGKK